MCLRAAIQSLGDREGLGFEAALFLDRRLVMATWAA